MDILSCFTPAQLVQAQLLYNKEKRFYSNPRTRAPMRIKHKGKVYPLISATTDYLSINSAKKDMKNSQGYTSVIVRYIKGCALFYAI